MSTQPQYRNESWLRERYIIQQDNISDIADDVGCSTATVHRWLKNHDIETREAGPATPDNLQNREWLHQQYVVQERSVSDIADEVGYTGPGVLNWLEHWSIERRGEYQSTPDKLQDKSWLQEQYTKKMRKTSDIASELGCSVNTISRWLARHGIETQQGGLTLPKLTEAAWLEEEYVAERRSTRDIADEIGCSQNAVSVWLNKHGIETRPRAPTGRDNQNWNGGPVIYGPGWNERKRQQVRERDGYTCQGTSCSMSQDAHLEEHGQKLHVHHLRKARDVKDPAERNSKQNLITLCRECHRRWERIADVGLVPQVSGVVVDD